MKIGDVSRPRRFANPARQRWYAYHRSVRFAMRMLQAETTVEERGRIPSPTSSSLESAGPTSSEDVLNRLAGCHALAAPIARSAE